MTARGGKPLPDLEQARNEQAAYGIPEYVFKAWKAQRDSAIKRGIPFRFGVFQWWCWWNMALVKIGPDAVRGRCKGQYMMARYGDAGAYEHGNVYAATAAQNAADIPPAVRVKATDKRRATMAARGRGLGDHLKLGHLHPCARPVVTPLGTFLSIRLAAKAHGYSERWGRGQVKAGVWSLAADRRPGPD